MSKSKSVSEKRAALNALRGELQTPRAAEALRDALADRSNRVVAKAAELIGGSDDKQFEADLSAAYARLLADPLKSDPGCLGKTAIVETLVKLQCHDIAFYRSGIKYQQHEPIWGGDEDSAAQLRAACAAGLVLCASLLEALNSFAELLADPCKQARIGAARAIAALAHPEGAPLVRLKLLVGDKEPEVVGECCAAMMQLAPDNGAALVVRLLGSPDPAVCVQVALALAESRNRRAFEPLRAAWQRQRELSVRATFLVCIGLLRSAEASQFLLSLVRGPDAKDAADALSALKVHRHSDELRSEIEEAVRGSGSSQLISLFEREFPRTNKE